MSNKQQIDASPAPGVLATAAALSTLLSLAQPNFALAADQSTPPPQPEAQQQQQQGQQGPNLENQSAPSVKNAGTKGFQLPQGNQWRYSEFLEAVENDKVERVIFNKEGDVVQALADGRRALVIVPKDPHLLDTLLKHGVDFQVAENPASQGGAVGGILGFLSTFGFPILLLAGLYFLFGRSGGGTPGGGPAGGPPMGGGGMNPFSFGKSMSKFSETPDTGITFDDVAGIDQAKLELKEVVDFLKNPEKYTQLGAKIPKGCLLVGPPGTGKTLLAKAVAGEAGVPFFSGAASEFVEMFVGVGSSRVRDLFAKAKEKAPCIVFIDEIDAVGRQRGAGMGGGNDEREQTVNQLLAELDGFEGNTGVIVLAATNRPDVLDQALLRPGRFDRSITVDRPDLQGRVSILKVHSKGKKLSSDVDLTKVARRTPGMTGADLQNLMNEAAILTARQEKTEITLPMIEDALEKIIAGPEKKGSVINERKRRLVAYHEAGHAIIGALLPEYDPVTKITIIPRGAAGGATFFAPNEELLDSGLFTKRYLENKMAVALGGRVAEEIILGPDDVTTGASGDFQQVSQVAKAMVVQCGFSKELGQVAWSQQQGETFVGGQMGQAPQCSAHTQNLIDREVKIMVDRAYRRAKDLVQANIELLHKIAAKLIENEQVDGEELMAMIFSENSGQYLKEDAPGVTIPYREPVAA
ncbi:hypothetical protein WJX73_001860 [Symbiochloris irregularis]|uniref:AAA+ ATPase domain-containing protein n=1 Tax=Symbiochloris irregularis TaxID=706552 RepID=A0AAW1NSD5_9CHLO